MLPLLHLSPPPSKLLLLEQSTRQASSSSSSSWCDMKKEMMRQHRQTLLLGAKLFCVPLRLASLACLLSKGFRTWLLCQSWRLSEGGGRGGGLGMTREACNGCKTRRERRRRRRRGFLRKTTVLETPAKKAANQTVLVVFLPSLERKTTLLFLSLSTFSSERL